MEDDGSSRRPGIGETMEMKLKVIGCSPAWPNPGGAQSGYLVEGPPGRVLLDCGAGVLAKLRELEDWPRIDAIASRTSTSTTGATSSRGSGRSGSALPPSIPGRTCGCRRAATSC